MVHPELWLRLSQPRALGLRSNLGPAGAHGGFVPRARELQDNPQAELGSGERRLLIYLLFQCSLQGIHFELLLPKAGLVRCLLLLGLASHLCNFSIGSAKNTGFGHVRFSTGKGRGCPRVDSTLTNGGRGQGCLLHILDVF